MSQETKDRRKGLLATIALHIAMIALFLFYGLTYTIPPPEEGIAINFGYEEDGSGTTTQSAQTEEQAPPPQPDNTEQVATQDVEEAPALTEEKPKETSQKPTETPKEETKPKPNSRLQGALDKTKNQPGTGQGEGETTGGGDQGDPEGDRNSPNRTGNGGTGNTGDYRLGNRKANARPKPIYDCPEEGRVVVKVYVDRNGKVVNAIPGEKIPNDKGSTTSSTCLYERAKSAAMRTTWDPDPTATDLQVGYIIYNFQKR